MTTIEVGKLVGKSDRTVSAWENNRGQPDAEMLMKLCDIYHVDNILKEFMPEDEPEKKEAPNVGEDDEREKYIEDIINFAGTLPEDLQDKFIKMVGWLNYTDEDFSVLEAIARLIDRKT